MAEADALHRWAVSTTTPLPPAATREQLSRHLEFMHAALPSRQTDVEAGRKRSAVYASLLVGHSDEALAFMARTACATLDWFPTPKQCLEIIGRYPLPTTPQAAALALCSQFAQVRFEEWLADVGAGNPVGDVPDQWLRIAIERDVLRRVEDGSYRSRALYHGPPRYVAVPSAMRLPA